jgi:large subunit ribosomal protein L13
MNQAQVTKTTKAEDIKRAWHLIDVDGQALGRVSTQIAKLLMGKAKPSFVRNLDCGDYVVVVNAKTVKATGKKEEQKQYFNYSGYPSGLRIRTLAELRKEKPTEIITHAVKGMLPQNKLRASMLKRLFVFEGAEHKYADKLK